MVEALDYDFCMLRYLLQMVDDYFSDRTLLIRQWWTAVMAGAALDWVSGTHPMTAC